MEDLTPLVRKIISDLRKTGCSGHKISKLTGVNLRTINKFLKRVRERGNEENLPRTGRRIKTDSRADHRLFRIVRENRKADFGRPCHKIQQHFSGKYFF